MNSRPHNKHARPAFSPYSGDGGNAPVVPRQPAGPPPHDGFAPPYHNYSNSNFLYGGAQAEHSGSFVPGNPFVDPAGSPRLLTPYESMQVGDTATLIPMNNVASASPHYDSSPLTGFVDAPFASPEIQPLYAVAPQDGLMVSSRPPYPVHQPMDRDAYRINSDIRFYSNPTSHHQFPLSGGSEQRWQTSTFPVSSALLVGSHRHSDGHLVQSHPSYHRFVAGGGVSAPSSVAPICQWNQCGFHLEDTSASGIKRHLRAHHGITRADCERGERGQCQWYVDGRPCGAPLDFSSFPKHVSTVHLKATARRCSDCGRRIGRADSLTRHQRDHCPVRRREWPE